MSLAVCGALTWADASRTVTWTRLRQGLGVQHEGSDRYRMVTGQDSGWKLLGLPLFAEGGGELPPKTGVLLAELCAFFQEAGSFGVGGFQTAEQ